MADPHSTTRPLRRDPLVASVFIATGLLAASFLPDTPWVVFVPLSCLAGAAIGCGLYVLSSAVVRVLLGQDERPD